MSQMSNRPCPKCGTYVDAHQRFCTNCGGEMDVAQQPFQAPIPTAPPPQNYPSFQQGNQQMSQYGQPQQSPPSYAQAQPKQGNAGGIFAALAALFLLRRGGRRAGGGLCGV